jgi:hypothetical protein
MQHDLDVNAKQMRKTSLWNLYVVAYTVGFGMTLLIFPNLIIPLLGFDRAEGPWIRVVGMCFLVLCYINIVIYREKGPVSMIWAIWAIRMGFVAVLIVLTIIGFPPALCLIAGIVLVGVIGTVLTYRSEKET